MDVFEILLKKRCMDRCRSMYVKQNGNMHISKKVYCYKYSSSDTLLSSPKTQSINHLWAMIDWYSPTTS